MLKCFILIILTVSLYSCSSSENTSSENTSLRYSIILGEGGGVTGTSEGIFIDTAGVVYLFRGRTFEGSEKKEKGVLAGDDIAKINGMFADIEDIEFRQSGNLYKFIILKKNDVPDLRFSWSDSPSKDDRIQPLEDFFSSINKLINKL